MARPFNSYTFIPIDLEIGKKKKSSIQHQLYQKLRLQIISQQLKPGAVIPGSRQMAKLLNISRNTCIIVYQQLINEGYLISTAQSKTIINPALEQLHKMSLSPDKKTNQEDNIGNPRPLIKGLKANNFLIKPFYPSTHRDEDFPITTWRRLITNACYEKDDLFNTEHPQGLLSFRKIISEYLWETRQIRCDPKQIFVTNSTRQAVDMICYSLVEPKDKVYVENPGYLPTRLLLQARRANIIGVNVDEEGCQIPLAAGKLAFITPSHQYPLGYIMSLQRRLDFLLWAQKHNAWIVEDDYDSEFYYGNHKPPAALHALDHKGHVIYMGNFSKSMYHRLRLGYMVVPEKLIDSVYQARIIFDGLPTSIVQIAMENFIEKGYFYQHTHSLRQKYFERQQTMLAAGERYLKNVLNFVPRLAGINITGQIEPSLHSTTSAKNLVESAAQEGIVLKTNDDCYLTAPLQPSFLLGYGGLEEKQISHLVQKLAHTFEQNKIG